MCDVNKIEERNERFNKKIANMVVHTCFNNKSYFGYKSNALKSGICKYYRRNEKEKFEWCVVEMLLFAFNEKGNGLITNLLNRLKILIMEDMSCCEIDRTVLAIKKINEFEKGERKQYNKIIEFCDIVIQGKKGRTISYLNCRWRNNPDILVMDEIILDNINKYKRDDDSEELLKLGEKLIEYLENYDERIIDIFVKMVNHIGAKRYRRTDGIYLFMEIAYDYCSNDKLKNIWEFTIEMLNRKTMKERYHFGVWFGTIMWKRNKFEFSKNIDYFDSKKTLDETIINFIRRKCLVLDKYVTEDWHVNKKYTLEKFSLVGAFVENEDTSILGDKFKKYKKMYVKSKQLKNTSSKKKIKLICNSNRVTIYNEKIIGDCDTLLYIPFDDFENIKVLEDGVCGGKVCCIRVSYKGSLYIIKEMKTSMNYGKDYIFVDSLKEKFGLQDLGMKRIKSNKGLVKIDKKKISFVKNWELGEKESIYCMMNFMENAGDVGKNKEILKNKEKKIELFKIRLFDGLFRSSDNILRNVLIGNKRLISIDEGDIYGKRKKIFNKHDWCIKNKDKEIIDEVLKDFELVNKINTIEKHMIYYGFDNHISEMKNRLSYYKDIVYEELGFK